MTQLAFWGNRDPRFLLGRLRHPYRRVMPLRRPAAVALSAGILLLGACTAPVPAVAPTATAPPVEPELPAVVLDPDGGYGDRYADGILPVGDEKWTLTDPAVGTVYLCRVPDEQAGAVTRGPWFIDDDTSWNVALKPAGVLLSGHPDAAGAAAVGVRGDHS